MSTAPDGFTPPRTNWTTSDPIFAVDLNRAEGNSAAIETGNRTLDQALGGATNVGTLRQFLSWFAGRIRAITGAPNWFDTPATTLTTAHTHHGSVNNPHSVTAAQVGATPAAHEATTIAHGSVGNIVGVDSSLTIDPVPAPTGNIGGLRTLLGWLSNRIRAITGATNWWDAPATTLATAHTHHGATAPIHGSTSAPTASTIMHRDVAGRTKVAIPVVSDDVARLDTVNNLRIRTRMGAM